MKHLLSVLLIGSVVTNPVFVAAQQPQEQDLRLKKNRTLDDYAPWTPPASKEAWAKRREQLREQVLVALGLWPMPPKTPLHPVIHGKIDRESYTIEKVFFASYPGHYVSGNLYRPKGKTGKLAGVLSPHGHWNNGRFHEADEKTVQSLIKQGAEKTVAGARYHLQARCAQLARMGCVVFHYDMVGYADSQQIEHRKGFLDVEAELRLQSFMGLQTWNSIRALDFLLSLPEVDPTRIGVTGASGGGTQTFILCAVDDRPTVAFPAVMVGTAMQGGCVCENCSYLRVGTGNIELAALFAPKPLGMSGANDWTKEIETKGLPQLKKLYAMLGAEDNVMAKAYLQFGHNYNQVSRELMYNWFNKHLKLGQPEPVVEQPFVPVPPKELSVYDVAHPLPPDAVKAEGLRRYLTETSDQQIMVLQPKDTASLADFRRVVGAALQAMVNQSLIVFPNKRSLFGGPNGEADSDVSIAGPDGEVVHLHIVTGRGRPDFMVVWVHPKGIASLYRSGKLVPAAQKIIDGKGAIAAPNMFSPDNVLGQRPMVNKQYAGFTFGYNRSMLANRVKDILITVSHAHRIKECKQVHLVGFEKAGPWVLLARGLCGNAVARTAADMDQFRFENVKTMDDEMMLPGAVKYGGLPAFTALAAPGELLVHNHRGTASGKLLKGTYEAAHSSKNLYRFADKMTDEAVVQWLLRETPDNQPRAPVDAPRAKE